MQGRRGAWRRGATRGGSGRSPGCRRWWSASRPGWAARRRPATARRRRAAPRRPRPRRGRCRRSGGPARRRTRPYSSRKIRSIAVAAPGRGESSGPLGGSPGTDGPRPSPAQAAEPSVAQRQRGVEVGRLDDPEAAEPLLGLGERAVGDDRLGAGGVDHGRGRLDGRQAAGEHPGALGLQLLVEAVDGLEDRLHLLQGRASARPRWCTDSRYWVMVDLLGAGRPRRAASPSPRTGPRRIRQRRRKIFSGRISRGYRGQLTPHSARQRRRAGPWPSASRSTA